MESKSPVPSSSGSYTPSAGDVVEFEIDGKVCVGLVFQSSSGEIRAHNNYYGNDEVTHVGLKSKKNIKKIGDCNIVPANTYEESRAIAKAYFEQKPQCDTSVEYKVGDLVETISADDHCFGDGDIVRIRKLSGEGMYCFNKKGSDQYLDLYDIQPLSGTYAERQAKAVEFYGWKVGSKVKVVRKFEGSQDGCNTTSWDTKPSKAYMQGGEFEIQEIINLNIRLRNPDDVEGWFRFPYFALEPVT